MFPKLPLPVWLILAALAYLLITCVLGCLAARVRDELERHDLAVRARHQRQSYRESVRRAKERVNSRSRRKLAA
ncbi:MAG: hypothetical protein ACODAQ_10240 [Phycisphaeraceae bacterium]